MGNTTKEFEDLTHDDIMYLAGVFSVAGCIGIKQMNNRNTLYMTIRSKNRSVVTKISRLFRTKVGVHRSKDSEHSSKYDVTLIGRNARNILDVLIDYVDEETQDKIILMTKLS